MQKFALLNADGVVCEVIAETMDEALETVINGLKDLTFEGVLQVLLQDALMVSKDEIKVIDKLDINNNEDFECLLKVMKVTDNMEDFVAWLED